MSHAPWAAMPGSAKRRGKTAVLALAMIACTAPRHEDFAADPPPPAPAAQAPAPAPAQRRPSRKRLRPRPPRPSPTVPPYGPFMPAPAATGTPRSVGPSVAPAGTFLPPMKAEPPEDGAGVATPPAESKAADVDRERATTDLTRELRRGLGPAGPAFGAPPAIVPMPLGPPPSTLPGVAPAPLQPPSGVAPGPPMMRW